MPNTSTWLPPDASMVSCWVSIREIDTVLPPEAVMGHEVAAVAGRFSLAPTNLLDPAVAGELAGAVDEVDVSLNAADGETYVRLCPNRFGAAAHAAACDFIRAVRPHVPVVKATVVAVPGLDLPACRRLAAQLGVPLRERPYFDPSAGEPHETAGS